jgi:hypothetical protein
VRKYLRSDIVEPKFCVRDRPSKLDPYADKLSYMLRQETGKSRKQKRTIKQLHADLVTLGYEGSIISSQLRTSWRAYWSEASSTLRWVTKKKKYTACSAAIVSTAMIFGRVVPLNQPS